MILQPQQTNIPQPAQQQMPGEQQEKQPAETLQPNQQQVQQNAQQQAQKPSRTDSCHCPDIIEEKVKPPRGQEATLNTDEERPIIRYARGRFLGKGGFAKAYEVKRIAPIETEEHRTLTWALKVVSKSNLQRSKARQKLTSEIKIHRSLNHENVVRFDRYFEDRENVYIMLDICHNQSLSDLVRRRKRLTEVEARYYIHQLVRGVQYVHQKNVIHRDLKLGNLFLTERMQLKIGDFGLAAQVFYEGERKRTVCGTPNYLAPEVLEGSNGHSYEVDYWSIGVILYTMLCGRPPFESVEVKQTYEKIKNGQFAFPDHISMHSNTKNFIRGCLIKDAAKRMNLEEMLGHEFFTAAPIPEIMPVSTLVCPPADQFSSRYSLPRDESLQQTHQKRLQSPKMLFSPSQQQCIQQKQQSAKTTKTSTFGGAQIASVQNPLEGTIKQLKSQKSLGQPQMMMNGAICSKDVSPAAQQLDSQQENGLIIASGNGCTTPTPQRVCQNAFGPTNIISEFDAMPMNQNQVPQQHLQAQFTGNNICNQLAGQQQTGLISDAKITLVDNYFQQTQNVVASMDIVNAKNQKSLSSPKVTNKFNAPTSTAFTTNGNSNRRSSFAMGTVTQTLKTPSKQQQTVKENNFKSTQKLSATQGINSTVLHTQQSQQQSHHMLNAQQSLHTQSQPQTVAQASAAATIESSELAKIQSTVADFIPVDQLIKKTEQQPGTDVVAKFVDFSSKYGLGYQLTNGMFGVLFNDSTKIVTVSADYFHFCYIERVKGPAGADQGANATTTTEHVQYFNFYDYPAAINKKVVLLQHFKSYLEGNSKFKPITFAFTKENAPALPAEYRTESTLASGAASSPPTFYIKKWKRAKKAILLRNSNKVIQVIFQDQSELILASGSGIVTFVNSKREIKECLLSSDQHQLELEDPSLFKRLQYAKDVLVQMMGYQAFSQVTDNATSQGVQKQSQQQALEECFDVQESTGQLQPAILSPPKMKSSQSTDGFNSIANRAAQRQINTAGKAGSAGRNRVYSGRGYEPSPMVSTPAGSAFNRSRTGQQTMSSSKANAANNASINSASNGLNRQRKSANSVSKVGGQANNNSIGQRSKECSLSGSSANVNALPKQNKKSPGKSFK